MKRRLYFLLQGVANARSAMSEHERNDIARNYPHAFAAKGIGLEDLPRASRNRCSDLGVRLETIFRDGNFALFLIALSVPGIIALMNVSGYRLLPLAVVMLVTLLAGVGTASRIPGVHLAGFADALSSPGSPARGRRIHR